MALGFFSRLKEGLTRSTQKLSEGISTVFRKRRLDDAALEELEEVLIAADLGTEVARRVIANFRRSRFGKEVTDEEIKQTLAEEIAAILAPVAQPLRLDPAKRPHVVLVVGVNGAGKTTTIGKLAQNYRGGRAVADLGRAHGRAGDRRQCERRFRGARIRCADARRGGRRGRAADRHGGTAAQQGGADG
jgi:signal recognition particle GTPase